MIILLKSIKNQPSQITISKSSEWLPIQICDDFAKELRIFVFFQKLRFSLRKFSYLYHPLELDCRKQQAYHVFPTPLHELAAKTQKEILQRVTITSNPFHSGQTYKWKGFQHG